MKFIHFTDLHLVLTCLGAGDLPRAEAWTARCAERVMAADDLGRSNHAVAREVALPLMRALLANARGRIEATHKGFQLNALRGQLLGGEAVIDGGSQADGSVRAEPRMDLSAVVEAFMTMARLPLSANMLFVNVMATKMPFVGRG